MYEILLFQAQCDKIDKLERFQNKSEPTFLFIQVGFSGSLTLDMYMETGLNKALYSFRSNASNQLVANISYNTYPSYDFHNLKDMPC